MGQCLSQPRSTSQSAQLQRYAAAQQNHMAEQRAAARVSEYAEPGHLPVNPSPVVAAQGMPATRQSSAPLPARKPDSLMSMLPDDILLRVAKQLHGTLRQYDSSLPDPFEAFMGTDRRLRAIGARCVKRIRVTSPEGMAAAVGVLNLNGGDEITLDGHGFTDQHLAMLPAHLKKLTLQKNFHVTDAAIARFEALESLDIWGCMNLTGEGWGSQLKGLKRLQASDSGVTDAVVAGLTNLEYLEMEGETAFTTEGWWRQLNKLKHLGAEDSGITDMAVAELTSLEYLDLHGCKNITGAGWGPQLDNLKTLYVDRTGITDAALITLPNIELLNVERCPNVTGVGWLGHLTALKHFSANFSALTDAVVPYLLGQLTLLRGVSMCRVAGLTPQRRDELQVALESKRLHL
jgi:hypothetical protein